jgi:hypothetical protein
VKLINTYYNLISCEILFFAVYPFTSVLILFKITHCEWVILLFFAWVYWILLSSMYEGKVFFLTALVAGLACSLSTYPIRRCLINRLNIQIINLNKTI